MVSYSITTVIITALIDGEVAILDTEVSTEVSTELERLATAHTEIGLDPLRLNYNAVPECGTMG